MKITVDEVDDKEAVEAKLLAVEAKLLAVEAKPFERVFIFQASFDMVQY